MNPSRYFLFNGKIIEGDSFQVGFSDRAFFYGDGVFETIRVMNTRASFLEHHLDRLFNAMKFFGMDTTHLIKNELIHLISELISFNLITSGRIRLQVWRKGSVYYLPENQEIGWLATIVKLDENQYQSLPAVRLKVSEYPHSSKDPLNGFKTLSSLRNIYEAQKTKDEGYFETLRFNEYGNITETSAWNFFGKIGNQILTPPLGDGILPGIIRQELLTVPESLGYKVIEKSISKFIMLQLESAFLTNVVYGIREIESINQEGRIIQLKRLNNLQFLIDFLNRNAIE